MATITGLTKERMQEIIDATIVDADVVGDNLILTKEDGSTIDAGNVRGNPGIPGSGSNPGAEKYLKQQGILVSTDAALTRNSPTSITIAAGSGWVKKASGVLVFVTWAQTNLVVRNPTNSALDQVVVNDTGVLSIQQGTDVAGVTLNNRTGANDTGINADKLRLWDLNPTSANGGIGAAGFRDRRSWANGARVKMVRTSNASAGNDYPVPGTGSYTLIDAVNLNPRVELTGAELELTLNVCLGASGANGHAIAFGADGVSGVWADLTVKAHYIYGNEITSVANAQVGGNRTFRRWIASTPTPGSHVIGLIGANDGATTLTMVARAGVPLVYTLQEVLKPSAANLPN